MDHNQSESGCQSLEFVIPGASVDLLRQNGTRVQRLFNVSFTLSNTFQRGNTIMQWINLIRGDSTTEALEHAKTYIISMTNPEAKITMENFPPSLYQSSVDEVSKEACAFLAQRGNSIEIQGSQLAVVLAQSMLESALQDFKLKKESNQNDASSEMVIDGDDAQMEILPTDLSMAMSIEDSPKWLTASKLSSNTSAEDTSIRILPSRNSGQSPRKISLSRPRLSPSRPSSETSHAMSSDSPVNGLFFVDRKGTYNTDIRSSERSLPVHSKNIPHVSVIDMTNDDATCQDERILTQYRYLKDFGLAQHYRLEIVEEALNKCDMTEVVKPQEFLNILRYLSPTKKDLPEKMLSPVTSLTSTSTQSKSKPKTVPSAHSDDVIEADTSSSPETPQQKQTSSSNNDSVILINSDSEENDRGGKLMDNMEAFVISSDEDQPFIKHQKKKQGKKQDAVKSKQVGKSPQAATRPLANQPPNPPAPQPVFRMGALRHIVIDGSNVAMHHGEHKVYSVKGIQICMNYFLKRGHKVTALVSGSRRYFQPRKTFPMKDKHLLDVLEKEGNLKFTPSRRLVTGKIITSYDDRFVLNLAQAEEGIVVSNDQYRDLLYEKPEYQDLIENRLLPFMFVGDLFMPPDDPLGRNGPTLEEFLRMGAEVSIGAAAAAATSAVPRGAGAVPNRSRTATAVTTGQKEKSYAHHTAAAAAPKNYWQVHSEQKNEKRKEKGEDQYAISFHQSNLENNEPMDLLQNAHGLQFRSRHNESSSASPVRSKQKTKEIFDELSLMFTEPAQQERILVILQNHPKETDMTRLCNFVINALAI